MPVFDFISRLIDDPDPVIVIPFGGYANDRTLHAQARVLEDEGIEQSHEDSLFRNVINTYKRFESDEVEGAKVVVSFGETKLSLTSDQEGYVVVDASHTMQLEHHDTLWIPITYELYENEKLLYTVTDHVLKPSPSAQYGIISDLDDTVIQTGVASTLRWRLIVNSFFKHSAKRLSLEGAQEFYELLHKGSDGKSQNPFFYLSNSPWNIHEYLMAFLENFKFPKGVLMLRDIGFENKRHESFLEGNKFVKISHILETYPNIPFVLIGDSADLDPDIYIEIARKFKNQVKAVYIRTIANKGRMQRVQALIEQTTDVEVILIEDSKKAIIHARANGLIL